MSTCSTCGSEFERKHSWQRLCWSCWRKQKDAEIETEAYSRGFTAGLEAARVRERAAQRQNHAGAMPDGLADYLPRLIQLCHPDRHDGSSAATAVTQWLLELRRRIRASTH